MLDTVGVLIVLSIVLVVVMFVGHGLWVFLAFLVRMLSGQPSRPYRHRDWKVEELDDLKAMDRQLKRLGQVGAVDDQVVDDIRARAEAYRRKLVGLPPRPSEAPPSEAPEEAILAEAVEVPEPPREKYKPPREQYKPPEPSAAPAIEPEQFAPPEPPPEPVVEPKPWRRSWAEMLETFMEERNMRWGELIGGLLLVGGGIALAISLRDKLHAIPYSQFFLFAAIAAFVYAVGLYSHHRWKLATTSRALLVIAMLLTPLSFLVMADLPKDHGLLFTLGIELVGLALFGYLLVLTARVLAPEGPWFLVLAVAGNSAAVLALAWLTDPGHSAGQWLAALDGAGRCAWLLVPAGCLPVAIFAGAVGGYLYGLSEPKGLDASRAAGLLTLAGAAAFAMILAVGLLISQGAGAVRLPTMLDCLAGPVALAAVPILAVGLTLVRGMVRDGSLEAYRATGTTIALIGGVVMLSAVGLAWPRPIGIIAIGTFNAAALVYLAFRYRLPIAHGGVIACAALVCLVGYHTATGSLLELPRAELGHEMFWLCLGGPSANVLGVLFVVLAAIAELLVRRGYRRHAVVYAAGCGALAVVGLSLLTWHAPEGGPNVIRAVILFAIYGCVSLGGAVRWERPLLGYVGLGLLLASGLWAAWWQDQPLWLALLVYSTLAAIVQAAYRLLVAQPPPAGDAHVAQPPPAGNATRITQPRAAVLHRINRVLVEPLGATALAASIPVLPWMAIAPPASTLATAGWLFHLAAIWFVLAWTNRRPMMVAASQAVLTLAALVAATAWLEEQEWFAGLADVSTDPWALQAYGVSLALLGLAWVVIRLALQRSTSFQAQGSQPLGLARQPTVDQIVQYTLVVAQLVLLAVCLVPGCGDEVLSGARIPVGVVEAACGGGAWLLLGLLAAWLVVSLWQRWGDAELFCGLLIALTAAGLIAGRFAADVAVASALRWALGVCLIVCSVGVWNRRRLRRWCLAVGAKLDVSRDGPQLARGVLIAGAVVPVLAITIIAAAAMLDNYILGVPAAGSFFDRVGPNLSYLVPLVLLIVGLVGNALREKSAAYAFAAGLVVELAVMLGYVLYVVTSGLALDDELITMVQLGTIAAAVWAGAWLATRRRLDVWQEDPSTPRGRRSRMLMTLQLALGVAGNVVLLLPALLMLVFVAQWEDCWIVVAGSPLGWIALISVAAVVIQRGRQRGGPLRPDAVGLLGMTVLGLMACTIQGYLPEWGFRCLMLGWAMYSLVVVAATWWVTARLPSLAADGTSAIAGSAAGADVPSAAKQSWADVPAAAKPLVRAAAVWVRVAGILAVLLGLKAAFWHHEQLWAAGAIAVASVAGAAMAAWRRREGWAFSAALGVNLAASLAVWHFQQELDFDQWWCRLIQANIVASSVVALVWLAARRRLYELASVPLLRGSSAFRQEIPAALLPRSSGTQLPGATSLGIAPLLAIQVTLAVVGNAVLVWLIVLDNIFVFDIQHPLLGQLGFVALAATAAVVVGLLWGRSVRQALPGLYLVGLTAVGTVLDVPGVTERAFCWLAALALAAFVLIVALAVRGMGRLTPLWNRLRIPVKDVPESAGWFSPTQQLVAAAAASLSVWVSIDFAFDAVAVSGFDWIPGRMAGPLAGVVLLAAAFLMTADRQWTQRARWQEAALLLGVVILGGLGWAWLDPTGPEGLAPWLHRSVVLMAAATVVTLVAGLVVPKILPPKILPPKILPTQDPPTRSDWADAGRRTVPVLGGLALLGLAIVLVEEGVAFAQSGAVPTALWAEVVVAVALVGLAVVCLGFAVVRGWDPMGWTDRQRTAYVYAAEVLVGLLCLHLFFAFPEFFTRGFFRRNWMLILMTVSFCGAGLAELFQRRAMSVLSEPLQRTALLMPLAPAVGFWFLAEPSPAVWFLMGLFYGFLAIARRSLTLAALGILTANVGLWVLWNRCGLHFLDHPQLWLIPIALCALVAEYFHHDRLAEAQSAALRYVALSVIYVSSTTEFFREIGESAWQPLVLVGLSVLGVLAGIVLRVRSFLYLGTTFLLVVIVRMILYAAFEQGHVWLFWAACIVLGTAILAMFAMFEKRRNDILAAMRRFKDWEQ